jgi:hypothetical protein
MNPDEPDISRERRGPGWAERGIAVYEDACARPEAVEDLRKRAEGYRAKLEPGPRASRPGISQPVRSGIETLTCANCGQEFQRTRVRGRKPLHCPECRSQAE